ncbi:PIG-L family deacetylase [Candidatus Dependentiae bacterium]|nr:PIG-L family deacetylase [Candidatus Dependentiae bacterium]
MKVLVIACHPDDELLGVGGRLIKHVKEADEVYVCILTKAYKPDWSQEYMDKKIEEQREVDQLIGIKVRINLDLPTVKLNTLPHGELNREIQKVVDKIKPHIIYTHCQNDVNIDHNIAFKSVLVVSRPPLMANLFTYETLSETEWGINQFTPNVWVDISDEIDKKIEAFLIYESEVKKYPHPRSVEGIKYLAGKRGTEACTKYAEAFCLIRGYNIK